MNAMALCRRNYKTRVNSLSIPKRAIHYMYASLFVKLECWTKRILYILMVKICNREMRNNFLPIERSQT